MVLVMSLWDDHDVHMLWLDSDYPPTKPVRRAAPRPVPCGWCPFALAGLMQACYLFGSLASERVSVKALLLLLLWCQLLAFLAWLVAVCCCASNPQASAPGVSRGTCATTSGDPDEVEKDYPNSNVVYSNLRVGDIGSTVPSAQVRCARRCWAERSRRMHECWGVWRQHAMNECWGGGGSLVAPDWLAAVFAALARSGALRVTRGHACACACESDCLCE